VLSAENSMAVHDIILLDENDARYLLKLEKGFASDLAIKVFHEQESDAILPDLVDAFPWPVSLTTKNETLKIYTTSTSRRAGLIYLALLPSLLALALIVTAGFKGTRGKMYEAGLLKALGWTTKDIVQFFMCRAVLIAFPACTLGMTVAYALVYIPGISWPGYLFFGWQSNAPGLYLDPAGSIRILLQVTAGIVVPYLASNLWPAIENATADPHQLLQKEGGW
jgi:ABC-type antimicrobial peptide transport system permease subunit